MSIDPSSELDAGTYRRRASILEPEREYRAEADCLVMRDSAGAERRLPWSAVRRVRLSFAPTEQKPGRFAMSMSFASGERLHLDNMHWRGFGEFEDRSDAYRRFVTTAVERVAELAPDVVANAGAPGWSYVGQIAMLVASFALLEWALSLLSPMERYANAVRVSGLLLGLPIALLWVVRARPRRLDLRNLPPSVLPRM